MKLEGKNEGEDVRKGKVKIGRKMWLLFLQKENAVFFWKNYFPPLGKSFFSLRNQTMDNGESLFQENVFRQIKQSLSAVIELQSLNLEYTSLCSSILKPLGPCHVLVLTELTQQALFCYCHVVFVRVSWMQQHSCHCCSFHWFLVCVAIVWFLCKGLMDFCIKVWVQFSIFELRFYVQQYFKKDCM